MCYFQSADCSLSHYSCKATLISGGIERGLCYRLMLCFKVLYTFSMGLRQVKAAGVTMFQEVAFIRLAIFMSHEPVPDPLYTIPILHISLVSPYNPLA
jgi:hypothetical protein